MTSKGPFLTGWCEGPNHHLCARFYAGRGDKEYMCECPCHIRRKVERKPSPLSKSERTSDVG